MRKSLVRAVLTVSAVLSLAAASLAQPAKAPAEPKQPPAVQVKPPDAPPPAMQPPQPSPEVAQAAKEMAGTWKCTGESPASPMGPAQKFEGTIKWKLDLDKMWLQGTYVGKKELVEKLVGPLFSRLKTGIASTVDNVIAEGDFVVVQVRGKAETKEGRAYDNSYCHVFKMRGGKIAEVTEYFDTELTTSVFG